MEEKGKLTTQDLLNIDVDSIAAEGIQSQKKRKTIIILVTITIVLSIVAIGIATSINAQNRKFSGNNFATEFAGVNFEMTQNDICSIERNTYRCTDYTMESIDEGEKILKFSNGHIYRFEKDGTLHFVKYTDYEFSNSFLKSLTEKYGDYTKTKLLNGYEWYGTINGVKCSMCYWEGGHGMILELDKE